MSLSTDITGYVAIAFAQAGDLVKTLTLSEVTRGAFDPATGVYPLTASTYTISVIDNDDSETIRANAFANRNVRSYIVQAGTLAKIGQKFTDPDDATEYTVFKISRIQQNSSLFVYEMWAEA